MPHWFSWFCMLSLATFLLIGCSAEKKGSGDEVTVTPLPPTVVAGGATKMVQLLTLNSGDFLALSRSDNDEQTEFKVVSFDKQGNWQRNHTLPITRLAHLTKTPEEALRYVDVAPRLSESGALITSIALEEWTPTTGSRALEKRELVGNRGYDSKGEMTREETEALRLARKEIYQKFVIDENGLVPPPVYFGGSGDIFVDSFFESTLFHSSTHQTIEIQKLLLHGGPMYYATRWQPIFGERSQFFAVGGEAEQRDLLVGNLSRYREKNQKAGAAELLLAMPTSAGELKVTKVALNYPSVRIWEAMAFGNKTILGGVYKAGGKVVTWVAVYDGIHLKEKLFELPQSSHADAIDVDPTTEEILVGGICDFTQATTGSLSDTSGYLLHLDGNLNLIQKRILRGERSTRVLAVKFNKGQILGAGYTDGPNTHSEKRGSKAFLWIGDRAAAGQ